jgi:diguanylate cyclase (GGDEF)-like protein
MAPPRDYRKPRNQEMRDLLVHLPHPVKVTDGSGMLLWQNQAAERMAEEPTWVQSPTTWQGNKAVLCMPLLVEDKPDPLVAELTAENERLRKHQRQTARRKKQAEETSKQTEKAATDVEKREQKLRQQLETAERRVVELETSLERSLESSIEASFEDSFEFEPSIEASVERGKGKGKGKSKGKKATGKSQETLTSASFEAELRRLEEAHSGLRADLSALQAAESRWKEEKSKLEAAKRAAEEAQQRSEQELERLLAAKAQLEDDKHQLEVWVEELESAKSQSAAPDSQSELADPWEPAEQRHSEMADRMEAAEQRAQEMVGKLEDAEQRAVELQQRAEAAEQSGADLAAKLETAQAQAAGLAEKLSAAESRFSALSAEHETYRQQTEKAESQRQPDEQLAARLREFEELERFFENEQKALLAQKQELEQRVSEQEVEFSKLRDSLRASSRDAATPAVSPQELEDLRADLAEAKTALSESTRREIRLSEKLEGANELKDEQSKVLALLKDELNDLRTREKELRDTLGMYGDFRTELDQARGDARRFKAEAADLREATEKLEAKLLESRRELAEARAAGPVSAGLSLRDPAAVKGDPNASASATVRSQLEFAQSRLRDTEKQLDEAREALKKARSESASAKDTEKLAFQDTLTGLPNRHIVDRYLDFSHKQAKSGNRAYSLFLIDIDGFRVLNETFGREWGDALLKAVGERLAGMRGANHIFARHSEDRFLLLAADLAKPAAEKYVEDACKSLLGALAHPFEVKGEQIKLTGSIGISLGPTASDDPRDMFSQAEVALNSAKARGVGSYFLHNEALLQKAQRDAAYLRQMEHAIERDEFQAVYQPIFNLNKGLVTGVELFVRWNHRDQRTLRPDEFLEVALRSGLIFAITDNIWPKAFKALLRWRKLRPGVTLSINLSDRELLSPKLVERVLAMTKAAGLEPASVLFEVRDASRLRVSGTWWSVLGALHGAGFGLVLDDYGSESSLFGTLAYSGFRQAKLLVDEKNPVCTPAPNAAKGVLYCAKRLQTRFDPKALKKAGFDMAQGFAVARPIDESQVDEVLER